MCEGMCVDMWSTLDSPSYPLWTCGQDNGGTERYVHVEVWSPKGVSTVLCGLVDRMDRRDGHPRSWIFSHCPMDSLDMGYFHTVPWTP